MFGIGIALISLTIRGTGVALTKRRKLFLIASLFWSFQWVVAHYEPKATGWSWPYRLTLDYPVSDGGIPHPTEFEPVTPKSGQETWFVDRRCRVGSMSV